MDYTALVTKKRVLLALSVFIGIICIALAANILVFRQTTTDPSFDRIPTSAKNIGIYFSQPLASVESVTIDDTIIDDVVVDNNSITVPLNNVSIEEDQIYTLTLSTIKSQWFGNVIDSQTEKLSFTYVEYNNLSAEQQKDQVASSNSGQVDDPFLNNVFPILDTNLNWQIEANNGSGTGVVNVEVTFLDEVPDYDNNGKVTQLPNDTAEQYRKEVIKKIKESNGNPDEYIIRYSNEYLNTKYHHSHHD